MERRYCCTLVREQGAVLVQAFPLPLGLTYSVFPCVAELFCFESGETIAELDNFVNNLSVRLANPGFVWLLIENTINKQDPKIRKTGKVVPFRLGKMKRLTR